MCLQTTPLQTEVNPASWALDVHDIVGCRWHKLPVLPEAEQAAVQGCEAVSEGLGIYVLPVDSHMGPQCNGPCSSFGIANCQVQ